MIMSRRFVAGVGGASDTRCWSDSSSPRAPDNFPQGTCIQRDLHTQVLSVTTVQCRPVSDNRFSGGDIAVLSCKARRWHSHVFTVKNS